jgi:hypothetical protein
MEDIAMSETYTYDNLLLGDDYITDSETMASGQNLKSGAALAKLTSGGNLTQLVCGTSDGSETPFGILAADCDASLGAKVCPIYIFGEFNQDAVGFSGSDTYTTFKAGFRDVGIYLKQATGA